jgi:hypothetical protein
MNDERKRCAWGDQSELLKKYHDEEWGVPVHDDRKHFEHLLMESMHCGLSWELMLKKREIFRACFADFDPDQVARFDDTDVARILQYPGMIRRRIGAEREFLRQELEKEGFRVIDGRANFLMVWHPLPDLAERLERKGILIRDCSDFSGVGKGWYRISLRSREDHLKLLQSMREIMEE